MEKLELGKSGQSDWKRKGLKLWGIYFQSSINLEQQKKTISLPPGQNDGRNIMIIISLAASVEAFTKSLLLHILMSNRKLANASPNIYKFLVSSMQNQSFNSLRKQFPIVLGASFSESVNTSKDIGVLMKFRHRLVHGQEPGIWYKRDKSGIKFTSEYSEICKYLYEEVTTIPDIKDCSGFHIEFLCDEVVDHFFNIVLGYYYNCTDLIGKDLNENFIKRITNLENKLKAIKAM